MKAIYSRELTILPSLCDAEGKLGIYNMFNLFMDVATEHADILNVGMKDLMPRGLFWLTARTRVRLIRRPAMMDRVTAVTWPEVPERSRCYRDYLLKMGDEVLIEGRTEWMILNMKNNRLYPADAVFPQDMAVPEDRVLTDGFNRVEEIFEAEDTIGEYTVRSTDIDVGGHMNNVAYVRAIVGLFPAKTLKDMDIREMEVAYRAPCYEGETLQVFCRRSPGLTELKLSRGEKTIALARIVTGP